MTWPVDALRKLVAPALGQVDGAGEVRVAQQQLPFGASPRRRAPARLLAFDDSAGLQVAAVGGQLLAGELPMAEQGLVRHPDRRAFTVAPADQQARTVEFGDHRARLLVGEESFARSGARHRNLLDAADGGQRPQYPRNGLTRRLVQMTQHFVGALGDRTFEAAELLIGRVSQHAGWCVLQVPFSFRLRRRFGPLLLNIFLVECVEREGEERQCPGLADGLLGQHFVEARLEFEAGCFRRLFDDLGDVNG